MVLKFQNWMSKSKFVQLFVNTDDNVRAENTPDGTTNNMFGAVLINTKNVHPFLDSSGHFSMNSFEDSFSDFTRNSSEIISTVIPTAISPVIPLAVLREISPGRNWVCYQIF